MIEAHAVCETQNASRYLQQLCKHFAHKVDVTYDATHGVCRFTCGTADMSADGAALAISVSAEGEDALAQTRDVIESHLLRFAFREQLAPLKWSN